MLKQHILKRVPVEEELPEIKNKEKYQTPTPFASEHNGSTQVSQLEGGNRDDGSSLRAPPKSDYKSLFSKHSNRLGSM
jgi:hypothetical protein